ncbi:MAG TPA: HNH endonuclease [Ferruginibacter sp.]|nr:HNH endonuclease [Ferruginibacter sp.]
MIVETYILESLYNDFVYFLKTNDEDFKSFQSSPFVEREENYKYAVYTEAKESLEQQWWKPSDIGTGKIQERVKNAIKTKLVYKYQYHNNNLVDWRKRDDFSKIPISNSLENTLFNFYKNKTKDSQVFDEFLTLGLSYQLIAYLYFIKDRNRYLPITQERFDEIFDLIGIKDFKTSGQASWDNYNEYIDIIKQVRDFLKVKEPDTTLLDAHSFLFILGSQMKKAKFILTLKANELSNEQPIAVINSKDAEGTDLSNDDKLPEELPIEITEPLFEGLKKVITVNAYERNPKARLLCIQHWKAVCAVCAFDFEEKYGDIGKGYIHVHHLIPVSQIGETYEVDPINDLRPVCPNCHAMLHRQKETLRIDELKLMIVTYQQEITNR